MAAFWHHRTNKGGMKHAVQAFNHNKNFADCSMAPTFYDVGNRQRGHGFQVMEAEAKSDTSDESSDDDY